MNIQKNKFMKRKYNIAIYPGTFEKFHEGHISVLEKAKKLFKKIYLIVSNNENKNSSNINERFENIKNNIYILENKNKIQVLKNEGLTIDILNKLKCYYIIRGVRTKRDFEYELNLYDSYKSLSKEFEIIYFFSDKELREISSTFILRSKYEK